MHICILLSLTYKHIHNIYSLFHRLQQLVICFIQSHLAVRLRIQFSTKLLSTRRGCGKVGVTSGPGNFSCEVGNYEFLKST